MKVCLVSFSHYPTLQNYMYLLKKNLKNKNIDVISIGNKNISTKYDITDNNMLIDAMDNASPTIDNIKLYIKKRNTIMEYIMSENPDVILFTSKHIWNYFMILTLKRKNIKLYHVFHDPVGHTGTKIQKGVTLYNKIIARYLKGIIVHSDKSYKDTKNIIKPKCSVKKVPLGEKKWLEYKKPTSYKNNLLIFGRISTYKGCEYIPELAFKMHEKGINCKITIAGKVMNDVDAKLLSKIKACSNINLVNEFISEDELDRYFYEADACLILHKSISQSGVIVDAYRHSKPIICFNIEGIGEFISGETALISRPFNIDDICESICKLYNDFDRLEQMSKAAYQFGREIFSSEEMANMIFNYIKQN